MSSDKIDKIKKRREKQTLAQHLQSLVTQATTKSLGAAQIAGADNFSSEGPLPKKLPYRSLPVQHFKMLCKGYDCHFLADGHVLDELICSNCGKVANRPFVSPCGHIYCKQFIDNWQGRSSYLFHCLKHQCKEINISLKKIRPDKVKWNEINSLLVECENVGCKETVILPSLRKHMMSNCSFRTITCRHCSKVVKHNEMAHHRQTDCEHSGRCEYVPIGCTDKEEEDCSLQHAVLKTGTLEDLELSILNAKELVHRTQIEYDQTQGFKKTIDWQLNEETNRVGNINSLGRGIEGIARMVSEVRGVGGVQGVRRKVPQPDGSEADDRTNVKELVTEAETSFEYDMVNMVQKLKSLDALIEEQMARIKNIKQEIEDRTRRYRNRHHLLNQDGMMIYPMKNFSKLRNESVQGKNKRILTASYKTHPRGYTFTGIVYPNGDGAGLFT